MYAKQNRFSVATGHGSLRWHRMSAVSLGGCFFYVVFRSVLSPRDEAGQRTPPKCHKSHPAEVRGVKNGKCHANFTLLGRGSVQFQRAPDLPEFANLPPPRVDPPLECLP